MLIVTYRFKTNDGEYITNGQRIVIFITAMLSLLIVISIFNAEVSELGDKGILIMSALIMLSFTIMFAEHYFTRPTDVIASTVAILLLLSPLHDQLNELGDWYWFFWSYNAFVLIMALTSLLLFDANLSETSKQYRMSKFLKIVASSLGNGKFLWFTLFALCLFFYVDNQSNLFLITFSFAAVLILIDPKKAIIQIGLIRKPKGDEIARIFGVQSANAYLARRTKGSKDVSKFDAVGFMPNSTNDNSWRVGLVLNTYTLNEEHWLRILTDPSLVIPDVQSISQTKATSGSVYLLGGPDSFTSTNRLVGVVCENSTIERLRFDYAFQTPVQEGDLLEVNSNGVKVLYQVVEGSTGTETLDAKDEAGIIIGEAVQLGVWDTERRCFERYGWVPGMNNPVFLLRQNLNSKLELFQEQIFQFSLIENQQ